MCCKAVFSLAFALGVLKSTFHVTILKLEGNGTSVAIRVDLDVRRHIFHLREYRAASTSISMDSASDMLLLSDRGRCE